MGRVCKETHPPPGPPDATPTSFSQTPLLARLAEQKHWSLYGEKPNRGSSAVVGAAVGGFLALCGPEPSLR